MSRTGLQAYAPEVDLCNALRATILGPDTTAPRQHPYTHSTAARDPRQADGKLGRLVPDFGRVRLEVDGVAEDEGLNDGRGEVQRGPVSEDGEEVFEDEEEVGRADNGNRQINGEHDEGQKVARDLDEEREAHLAGETARVDCGRDVGDGRETQEHHDETRGVAASADVEQEVRGANRRRRVPARNAKCRELARGAERLDADDGDEQAEVHTEEEREARRVGGQERGLMLALAAGSKIVEIDSGSRPCNHRMTIFNGPRLPLDVLTKSLARPEYETVNPIWDAP